MQSRDAVRARTSSVALGIITTNQGQGTHAHGLTDAPLNVPTIVLYAHTSELLRCRDHPLGFGPV